jgi:hypothetical protein
MAVDEKIDELEISIETALENCRNIIHVLFIYSAVINGLGLCIDRNAKHEALFDVYEFLYNETQKMETSEKTMEIFVSPKQFRTLSDSKSQRPPNIKVRYKKNDDDIIDNYNIKQYFRNKHPITRSMRICNSDITDDCTVLFSNIKNEIFKPLAQIISCHCSFFKQRLEKINDGKVTYREKGNISKISKADYRVLMISHQAEKPEQKPPIVIRKYKDTDDTCEQKTYLSQLFQKVCIPLYKPPVILPKTDTLEHMTIAAFANVEIANFGGTGYFSYEHLHVFDTPILRNEKQTEYTNIPICLIMENKAKGNQEQFYTDDFSGPTIQFFTDVMKELLDYEVFIPTETFFNNQRYELNTKFHVEKIKKLEFYRNLPQAIKDSSSKEDIVEYFYLFVGNLIHFAAANNIELPFKLSRMYIIKLYNLFDFLEVEPGTNNLKIFSPDNLETRLLLISIYLLEKAPTKYTKEILKIFEDPKKLLDPSTIYFLDINFFRTLWVYIKITHFIYL